MTAAKTPSQRGRANRNKGLNAERDLCKWLRANGFGGAERAVRTGFRTLDRTSADPGDVTGTPGIVWSVKDCAVERHLEWRGELVAMLNSTPFDTKLSTVGLIVHKRRGHANPADWWVWIHVVDLATLFGGMPPASSKWQWFRTTLGEIEPLLRAQGYGDPTEAAS